MSQTLTYMENFLSKHPSQCNKQFELVGWRGKVVEPEDGSSPEALRGMDDMHYTYLPSNMARMGQARVAGINGADGTVVPRCETYH